MKKIMTVCSSMLIAASIFAQAPNKMSYQAVIRNNSKQLITNQTVGMRISIIQGTSTGPAVYVETQTPTTNANGLATIEIGNGTVVLGTFATINWANGPYYVKTETDPNGSANYTIFGVSQLLSVPYALYAAKSGDDKGFTHYIGELFGGGIVVAVWKENGEEHGLIASLTDLGQATYSSITGTLVGTTGKMDGQANTTAIVAQGDVSGAAHLCNNYTSGGFSDWYLPSFFELTQCYNSLFIVNSILSPTDGFRLTSTYWSSTETDDSNAYVKEFFYGTNRFYSKALFARVRAVRKF